MELNNSTVRRLTHSREHKPNFFRMNFNSIHLLLKFNSSESLHIHILRQHHHHRHHLGYVKLISQLAVRRLCVELGLDFLFFHQISIVFVP